MYYLDRQGGRREEHVRGTNCSEVYQLHVIKSQTTVILSK
jgi:hypothetical protein